MKSLKAHISPLVVLVLSSTVLFAEEPKILLNPNTEWGAASADVQAVLKSTVGELIRYFPDLHLDPVRVDFKANVSPIVLFKRP